MASAWCIRYPEGLGYHEPQADAVATTKSRGIRNFVANDMKVWKSLRKTGFRCEKIVITWASDK